LAFLDLEKSNEIAKKISEVNSDFIYINVPQMFQKNMSSKEISEKKEISVFINDIPAFLSEFSKQKNRILAPISAIIKK
jgi:wyosine [tRNA(Phe)-imidazoG37] synthetase (radical SAM superfamily)